MNRGLITNYLCPENVESFWFWASDLESINWWTGETIAFHEEIEWVLRKLHPFGLPHFSEIILVLAACRNDWQVSRLEDYLDSLKNGLFAHLSNDLRSQLLDGLSNVHRLYLENRMSTLERKVTILEILFENDGHHLSADEAKNVSDELGDQTIQPEIYERASLMEETRSRSQITERTPTLLFVSVIRNLLEVLPRLEKIHDLSIREETGFDHPIEPAPETEPEESDSEATRSLIEKLTFDTDKELAGLGQIARDLLGVLNIPRDLADPEEMPMGGFSDIANHGSLDRLLLTEMAQDDEVLAVRVALNEALYLRRESPPKNPPRHRRIFIDNGIRLWGMPRAFAHSAALALAGNAGRDSVEMISTDADYQNENPCLAAPIDFRDKDGLIEGLTRLSPAPQPAKQLVEFLQSAAKESTEAADQIFVTHPSVVKDPEFLKLLSPTIRDLLFYIVTVDETGALRMFCRTPNGDRELQKLRLDVDKLYGVEDAPRLRSPENGDPSLPAIFNCEPFPLRVSQPINEQRCWTSDQGDVISLTKRGLLLYREKNRGAITLSNEDFGRGHCLFGKFDGDLFVLGLGRSLTPKVITVDLGTGVIEQHRYSFSDQVLCGSYLGGRVIFITQHQAIAINCFSGDEIYRTRIRGKRSETQGRFLRLGNQWYAMAVSDTISLTKIDTREYGNIEFVFDCPLYPVPLVLTQNGKVYFHDGDKYQPISFTIAEPLFVKRVIGLEDGGNKLLFQSSYSGNQFTTYDFANKQSTTTSVEIHPVDTIVKERRFRTPTLRKNFYGVRVVEDLLESILELMPRSSGAGIPITLKGNCLILEGTSVAEGSVVPFLPIESPFSGIELKKAELPNGSAVFLDSRGMIHLKSDEPETPEVTLVLKDQGMLSGWLSTGQFFGQGYFIGDHNPIPAKEAYQAIIDCICP